MKKLNSKVKYTLAVLSLFLFMTAFPYQVLASDEIQNSKTYHFGFKKSKNGQLPSIKEEGFEGIINKHDALFLGSTDKKVVYLTFDNGYENGYTAKILDILKEKQVPATFFVTGQYVKDQQSLLKRMVEEGHIIGNHSWSHPDMTTMSDVKIKEELKRVKGEVAKITGQTEMNYLRPPRGIFNERVLKVSKDEGYTSVFWSLAYKDWEVNNQKGKQYAYDQIMRQIHPGAIMLIHSVSVDNATALPDVIDAVRKQGYVFESLDQLMLDKHLIQP